MIKIEKIEVFNLEGAIRGMRNPHNSHDKSDSYRATFPISGKYSADVDYIVGENDLKLMQKLYKGGPEHRKFMRQIFCSLDITAPLYWWKEADTYTVGVVKDSCSTMHSIADKEFELGDFSHEYLDRLKGKDYNLALKDWNDAIRTLNYYREKYNNEKDSFMAKIYWMQMIEKLPSSYNQKRTVTMNYENVVNIIRQRTGHKLNEWRDLIVPLYNLPYLKEIMKGEKNGKCCGECAG